MIPFIKEPLKEYLEKNRLREKQKKKRNHESIVLIIILAVFMTGIFYTRLEITGMIIGAGNSDMIEINQQIQENTTLSFNLLGNITSLRISGVLIGNGSFRIMLGDKIVVDSSKLESTENKGISSITGLAVDTVDTVDAVNDSQNINETLAEDEEIIIEPIIAENISEVPVEIIEIIAQETVNESAKTIIDETIEGANEEEIILNETISDAENNTEETNATINETGEINISFNETGLENITEVMTENITEEIIENATIEINITETLIENLTVNVTENITGNIMLNETINETIEIPLISIIAFEDYCLETCILDNLPQEIVLSIELENAVLNLTSISYTYIESLNDTINLTLNLTQNLTENLTGNITYIINESAVLQDNYSYVETGIPVQWTKIIDTSLSNYTALPKDAFNITVEENIVSEKIIEEKILEEITIDKNTVNETIIDESAISGNDAIDEIIIPELVITIPNTTADESSVSENTIEKGIEENIENSSETIVDENTEEKAVVILNNEEISLADFNEITIYKELNRQIKELEKPVHEDKAVEVYNQLTELNKEVEKLDIKEDVAYDEVIIDFKNQSGKQMTIKYYTPGPVKNEQEISPYKKIVTVSSDIDYQNVFTSADILDTEKEKIKVYWLKDTGKELFTDVEYIDTNGNGLIDKLQWIVPHLSNQTFEISIIVLNPVTYLRDGETWIVAFNTTGIANLTISSPNAGWTEFLADNTDTFDEMTFLNLSCGEDDLKDSLKLIGFDNNTYDYSALQEEDSIDIQKLLIVDYECNTTGYFSNYMNTAGYATLLFEFENENASVFDYAYDPAVNYTWCYQENATTVPSCGGMATGSYGNDTNSTTNGAGYYAWAYLERLNDSSFTTSGNCGLAYLEDTAYCYFYINYTKPSNAVEARWSVRDGDLTSASNLSIDSSCFSQTPLQLQAASITRYLVSRTGWSTWSCRNSTGWYLLRTSTTDSINHQVIYEEGVFWNLSNIPSHDTPTITPVNPNPNKNLTCSPNNVQGTIGYSIKNITTWYKNNQSILSLYLPFEGGSNSTYTKDYSGYGNNGVVNGITWNIAGGKIGGAYQFDGSDDNITISDKSDFSPSLVNKMTVSLWANVSKTAPPIGGGTCGSTGSYIISKGQASNWEWAIELDKNNITCFSTWTLAGSGHMVCNYTSYLNDSAWHYYTFVIDYLNSIKGYIDGVEVCSAYTYSGVMSDSTASVRIGARGDGNYFNGTIDEVKIYNATLTPVQIAKIYADESTGVASKTIVSDMISLNEEWKCSITPNDGYGDGTTKNSSMTLVNDSLPTHDTPAINPASPNLLSNLTCNAVNLQDADGDSIQNITNWYLNNQSILALYFPFEGSSNSTYTKDYSGNGNNGVVNSASFNRTGGKVGGGYNFGVDKSIKVASAESLNPTSAITAEAWVKITDYDTLTPIINKGAYSLSIMNGYPTAGINAKSNITHMWTYIVNPGIADDYLKRVTTDSKDNIIAVGASVISGQYDSSLTKLSPNGSVILNWTIATAGAGNDRFYDLMTDSSDNIYVVGQTIVGEHAVYLVKYNSDGVYQWNHTSNPTTGVDQFVGVGVSNDDTLIVAVGTDATSGNQWRIMAFNSTGTNLWNRTYNISSGDDGANAAVFDSNDFIYVGGFDYSSGDYGWRIMKFNKTGANLWNYTKDISLGSDQIQSLRIDSNDNLLVGGRDNQTGDLQFRVMKFNSTGSNLWNYTVNPSSYNDNSFDIQIDSADNIWIAGEQYLSATNAQIILIKINSSGSQIYNLTYDPSIYIDRCQGIVIDSRDNVICSGRDLVLSSSDARSIILKFGNELTSSTRLAQNTWYHLAMSYDGSDFNLYINGTLKNTSSFTSSIDKSEYDIGIGTSGGLVNWSYHEFGKADFNGSIDEVKIYNRALSASQIQQEYSDGSSGKASQTLVNGEMTRGDYWHCSLTPNDGFFDGTTKNSTYVSFSNYAPTQDAPTITPTYPNATSNLTCNWNNVVDQDNTLVVNITTWYKNNVSMNALYLPFDGGTTSTYTKDYSGNNNHGDVWNAMWAQTTGKIGYSYDFDTNKSIFVNDSATLDVSTFTIEAWINADEFREASQIISKGSYSLGLLRAFPRAGINAKSAVTNIWNFTSNATSGQDIIYALGIDSQDNILLGGYDSAGGGQWRVMKLNSTGSNIWNFTSNATSGQDIIYALGIDSQDNILLGGYDSAGGNQWRVMKLNSTGSNIWNFTSNPTSGSDIIYALGIDSQDNILLGGYDSAGGYQWRVMKLNSTGSNIWNFTSNPTSGPDLLYALGIDSQDNILLGGYDSAGGTQWRAMKLNSSGSNIWNFTSNATSGPDAITALGIDSQDNILLGGYDSAGGYQWRVMKLNSSGSNIWNFTSNATSGSDIIYALGIDSQDNILLGGSDSAGGGQWRVMKLNSTGSNIWNFTSNATRGTDNLNALGIDSQDNILLGGSDSAGGTQWRAMKLGNEITSSKVLNVNEWYHLALTYDETTLKLYLNGTLINSTTITSALEPSVYQLGIGASGGKTNWNLHKRGRAPFKGTIDEVKIYNYAASAGQIYQDYLAGYNNRTANILTYESFTSADELMCQVAVNDYYGDGEIENSTHKEINGFPYISVFTLLPSSPNTSVNINCNATAVDADSATFTVEYWWYNNTVFRFGGNKTVTNNTNTVISTLTSGNTTKNEVWNCTIRAFDSVLYSEYNSTTVTIQNTASYATLNNPSNNTLVSYGNPILLNATYTDDDADAGTVIFVNSSNAAVLCTNSSVSNNTKVTCAVNMVYGQELKWYVNTTDGAIDGDGTINTKNGIWNFSIVTNSAPRVTVYSLLPSLPNTSSEIYCNATVIDDYNATFRVEYWWYNNSVFWLGGNKTVNNNSNTLISSLGELNTTVGEIWNCTIRAHDGFNSSNYNSSTVTIQNMQPIGELNAPSNNTGLSYGNPILLNITYIDGDGTAGTVVFVNNSNAAVLCTNSSVSNNTKVTCAVNMVYGQELKWYANTSDGTANVKNGVWNFSIISNIGPLVNTFTLLPSSPNTSSEIYCNATVIDEYNTSFRVEYWWYNNTVFRLGGNKTVNNNTNTVISTLGSGNTTKGETWNCTIRAYDGYNYGSTNSSTVTIQNNPPVMASARISPTNPNILSDLLGYCNATDQNNDTVTYSWTWYNNGVLNTSGQIGGIGGWCYQEYTDDGSGCGGGDIGDIWSNDPLSIDGDWEGSPGGLNAITYLKPSNADNSSLWMIYDSDFGIANITIDSRCWDYSSTNLTLRSGASGGYGECTIYYQCFNGTWITMSNAHIWTDCYGGVVEEAMWWFISSTPLQQGIETNVANITTSFSYGQNWTLACMANDGTANSTWLNTTVMINDTSSRITSLSLTPSSPNTSSQINCNATIVDAENSTLNVGFWWYNGTSSTPIVWGNKTVNNNTNTVISTLGSGNTTKGETWNCTIRAYDGSLYSTYNSTTVSVENSAPSKPTLLSPTNGNITVHDRRPFFNWIATDADNTPLNYTINITFSSTLECGPDILLNVTAANYTPAYDFCTDRVMYWEVRAYDGTEYSEWSDLWNFTIESFISINLTTNSVDFGSMNLLEEKDTDTMNNAFVIENTGNILINVSRISANASLFENIGLNTQYFQFKADNTTEMPSFNWTASITAWENITDISVLNKTIIKELDYNDSHDTAQIDIRIQIPVDEPPGNKKAAIYIIGEQS